MPGIWEEMVSLNSQKFEENTHIDIPSAYVGLGLAGVSWNMQRFPLDQAVRKDTAPLPATSQREGYYGDNHFAYWASGLRDYDQIVDWLQARGKTISSVLDIGCATGRFLRHLYFQTDVEDIYGCDINRLHVDWSCRNLPTRIKIFQNTSMPSIPLPSESLDFVTAFSVFTHIESFDTTWLMEIRRVLKKGGVAWLTIHGDRVWKDVQSDWPLYNALIIHPDMPPIGSTTEIPQDRFVLRWFEDKSYSSNVFYKYSYIRSFWGRYLDVVDIFPARPHYQDVVVLMK